MSERMVVNRESLEAVADAIREKGGTDTPLTFPDEFVQAIEEMDTAPEYRGEYVVTPRPRESVTLLTNGKKMNDDVVVNEIPFYETDNPSGGTTIYIGE